MRDFFIRSFEIFVSVFVVMMIVIVIGAAIGAAGTRDAGLLGSALILLGGAIYVIIIGGAMYLGLGIYHNTRRTAEALEELAKRG